MRRYKQCLQIRLYDKCGALALYLFVSGGKKVTVPLPGGVYTMKIFEGTDWYGPEVAFGSDSEVRFEMSNCPGLIRDDPLTLECRAGFLSTLSLYKGDGPSKRRREEF